MRIWFMADALGCAATLPLMLFLLTREKDTTRAWGVRAADIAWASVLGATALAVFGQSRYPLLFMLFPPLVATLFRFRLVSAVYGASLIVVAAAFTAEGYGPFVLSPGATPTERVMMFQLFGLVAFGSCIPLGFSIEERHRLEGRLRNANRSAGGSRPCRPAHRRLPKSAQSDPAMASEWARARTTGASLSLLFLDIDFFKRFNDQLGDECPWSVATILTAAVRESSDLVIRYGGEEFVILLQGAAADSARETADRVVSAIAGMKIPHQASPFGILTVSIGIATASPSQGGDPGILMRRADEALYSAKRAGRHRIEAIRESVSDLQLQA